VTSGQWVMGYYPGYDTTSYPMALIDWSCLTHIAFGPLKANPDGTLNLDFDDNTGKPGQGEKNALALSAAARAHGVKSLLMLGGAGEGPPLAQAAQLHLETLVDALLMAVEALGYDGLDLDWEDAIVEADLLALAQKLRSKRPGILLTYPGPAINPNFMSPDAGLAALHPYLDRFSVMSYYPATAAIGGGWESWFSSPLSGAATAHPVAIDDSLQRWAAAGVPKSKLMMGIGGYAICYPSYITAPRQQTTTGAIGGGDNNFPLGNVFASSGPLALFPAARSWDAVAQQPYLSLPPHTSIVSCGLDPTRYIPYDDEESLNAKGKWSQANGYGGTIVWTLQQLRLPAGAVGGRAPDALVQALRTGFLM
jgi:chitinase